MDNVLETSIIRLASRSASETQYYNIAFRFKAVDVLDMDNADDLNIYLKTLFKGGASKVIIDMEDLEFIDSSGIGIIITATKLARKNKGDLVLVHVSERIKKILEPVNMERFLRMFDSEKEAIEHLKFIY